MGKLSLYAEISTNYPFFSSCYFSTLMLEIERLGLLEGIQETMLYLRANSHLHACEAEAVLFQGRWQFLLWVTFGHEDRKQSLHRCSLQ